MIYAERYPSKFSLEILTTIFFLVITFPYPKKEVGGGGRKRSGILPLVYVCKLFSFEVLALLVTLMSGRVPS